MRGTNLTLRNLTWPGSSPAAVDLSTPMPSGGTLKARGTLSIQPTRVALEAELDQVDLGPARPYVPFEARVRGKVSGRVKINGTFGETIALVVDGDATAERLTLGDDERRLATVQRAEMAGFRYQYPTSIRIRQITLRKPWLLFERNSDGSFELASLFVSRTAPTTPPPAGANRSPASAAAPVRVLIGTLTMEDGFVRFVDRTTDPDFAEELSAVALTAEGLGTRPSRHAKVALRTMFASGTPLAVRGEVGGFTGPHFLDLTVDITDYPVPRLNPYLDHLLGWVAKNGTLTATMQLPALGRRSAGRQRRHPARPRSRPGRDGQRGPAARGAAARHPGGRCSRIARATSTLNVPVRGSLSAPEFHYGEAVWAAIRGHGDPTRGPALQPGRQALLHGGLAYRLRRHRSGHRSRPARRTPTPPGSEQLGKLATFLTRLPAVRLRLRPVTTVADVTSLRREALDARLAQAGADAAARRQAAVGLYTELFPLPAAAHQRRGAAGCAHARDADAAAGAPRAGDRPGGGHARRAGAGRHRRRSPGAGLESRAAVESEGAGRVEFEIAR